MQFVLLAAGKGSRLKLETTNKCFATVNGKTLLDYNLDLISPMLFDELIVVLGYNGVYIEEYLNKWHGGIKVKFIYQEQQLGIAHAIKTVAPHIKGDFAMCLSDEILCTPYILEMAKYFMHSMADCTCGTVIDSEQNIRKAYTLKLDTNNRIMKITEKPDIAYNSWKGTGFCMMKSTMLDILEHLQPNKIRKEYEMGDWIQLAVDTGLICNIYEVAEKNFNINEISDIQRAEKYIRRQNQ